MADQHRPAFLRASTYCRAVACMAAISTVAGCASIPGAAPEPVELATMFGPTFGDARLRSAKSERYAFARARVPITITGRSVLRPGSIAGATPTYAQAIALAIGPPKYAADTSLSARIAKGPGDQFLTQIDDRHMLRTVSAPALPSSPLRAQTTEIKVLEAITRGAAPGPIARTLTRVSSQPMPSFRHEAEIDPGASAELEAFNADLGRVAGIWRLKLTFDAAPTDVEIGGQRVTLGPVRDPQCGDPVCFRLPIPYHLRVTSEDRGWNGKIAAIVWLPNEGPLGSLDVRQQAFAGSGLRAVFENGMLHTISANDQRALALILRLPATSHTASISR